MKEESEINNSARSNADIINDVTKSDYKYGFVTDIDTDNLYSSDIVDDILEIKTYYERQWLSRGLTIKYIKFHLPKEVELIEPDIEIEEDTYRSFSRGYIQCPQEMEKRNTK